MFMSVLHKEMKRKAEMKRKKEKSLVTIKCKNCNGLTEIPLGSVGKCDYCGSPIRAPYDSSKDIFSFMNDYDYF